MDRAAMFPLPKSIACRYLLHHLQGLKGGCISRICAKLTTLEEERLYKLHTTAQRARIRAIPVGDQVLLLSHGTAATKGILVILSNNLIDQLAHNLHHWV